MLKLMYLTNDPQTAVYAEQSGVDRIFIDLELRGKVERQGHLDTVISHHSVADIRKVKAVLRKSELLVRVNSIYDGSAKEIDEVIRNGADIVMLPFFKTAEEVKTFVSLVGGRARTCLLCETPEAAESIDEILSVGGIDEVHIGLNDLHLGYGLDFMFQLYANGTVDTLAEAFKRHGVFFGIGGTARIGGGLLPAEYVIAEHYRLGSGMVILSRAFCDTSKVENPTDIPRIFREGVSELRAVEEACKHMTVQQFAENHEIVVEKANLIAEKLRCKKAEGER